jgi:NAD(P)-dependent dehydrogenase (short-subunit alcohol dehydrogenase family)
MNDKVVLITGAAHGLGRALTSLFLSKGWSVVATDIDEQPLMDFKKNPETLTIQMDVTSGGSVRSAFEKVRSENMKLDLVINNAGIDRYFPLSEMPVEHFKEIFEVNLFGGYRVNQTFLPIVKKPGGRILHISSESLHLNVPFMPYPISKMAVEGYAKTLRQELKFSGIEVVIVRPGAIRTRLLETVSQLKSAILNQQSVIGGNINAGSEATKQETTKQWQLAVQIQKFAEEAPKNIGKVLKPEEVAAFIFKVSQKSNPKAVYKINNGLQLKIAALLPFSLVEKMARRRLTV